jgi:hypothetical protein
MVEIEYRDIDIFVFLRLVIFVIVEIKYFLNLNKWILFANLYTINTF